MFIWQCLKNTFQVKLLTKYALLVDCQRRAGRIRDALKTASTVVLVALKTASDAHTLKQPVRQWVSVKHELVKDLQEGEKQSERCRFAIEFKINISILMSINLKLMSSKQMSDHNV